MHFFLETRLPILQLWFFLSIFGCIKAIEAKFSEDVPCTILKTSTNFGLVWSSHSHFIAFEVWRFQPCRRKVRKVKKKKISQIHSKPINFYLDLFVMLS